MRRDQLMPQAITNDDAQYAFDVVKTICTKVGPGLPNSPQERKRAAVIEKELEASLGTGIKINEFWLFCSKIPHLRCEIAKK